MIKFSRERLVTQDVTCSLKEFMDRYYVEARFDWEDDTKVLIYVNHYNPGNMEFAFEVPVIRGSDLNNKEHVERMIKVGLKENNHE